MIRTPALLAVAAVVLVGCSKPAEQAPAPRPTPTPFVAGGWAALWGDAPETVSLLDRMGFRLGEYRAAGQGYHAEAMPTPMGDPSNKPVNTANLAVVGGARQLDTLRFSLDLVNDGSAAFARQQFARWIGSALTQIGAPGAQPVVSAIEAEHPGSGTVTGAAFAVTREPIPGGRRWVVTFSRPDAKADAANPRKE